MDGLGGDEPSTIPRSPSALETAYEPPVTFPLVSTDRVASAVRGPVADRAVDGGERLPVGVHGKEREVERAVHESVSRQVHLGHLRAVDDHLRKIGERSVGDVGQRGEEVRERDDEASAGLTREGGRGRVLHDRRAVESQDPHLGRDHGHVEGLEEARGVGRARRPEAGQRPIEPVVAAIEAPVASGEHEAASPPAGPRRPAGRRPSASGLRPGKRPASTPRPPARIRSWQRRSRSRLRPLTRCRRASGPARCRSWRCG